MNDNAYTNGVPIPADPTNRPDPWEVFGARVRQARLLADVETSELTMRELCPDGKVEAVESGTYGPVGRPFAEYLDSRLSTDGVLVDAWARALLTDKLSDRAPVTSLFLDAEHIGEFAPLAVPEFFQTRDYAAALAVPGGAEPALRDQEIWFTGRSRPTLTLLTTEAALRRVVGSVETTREQLRHLRKIVTTNAHIRLHVLPDAARTHPGWRGAFRMLTFSAHHALAHQPHALGPGTLITDAHRLRGYTALYSLLQSEALGSDLSLSLLNDTINTLTPARAALDPVPDRGLTADLTPAGATSPASR